MCPNCHCGGDLGPGANCVGLCLIHQIAVTISGIVACPDIIDCCTPPAFCTFPTGAYTPCNSKINGTAPNGTYILRTCSSGNCQFSADLGVPFTSPDPSCQCSNITINPVTWPVCDPTPHNTPSFITGFLDALGPGGTVRFINAGLRRVQPGGRACSICCGSPATPAMRSQDIQYNWQIAFGNSSPGITPAQFCDGVPAVFQSPATGTCNPCGFAGPGTFGTNHQAASIVTTTVVRVN